LGSSSPLEARAISRTDDAGPEDFLPEAVDGDTGEQRILWRYEPLREAETVAWKVGSHWRQDSGDIRCDLLARLIVHAAKENVGERSVRLFGLDVRESASPLQCELLGVKSFVGVRLGARDVVELDAVIRGDGGLFFGSPV
jgi:hypothetical protein